MATLAWPSMAATTCGGWPSSSARVAAVCRRAWNETGRIRASSRIGNQRRENKVCAGMGCPSGPGHTRSPTRGVRASASTAMLGKYSVRLPAAVLGAVRTSRSVERSRCVGSNDKTTSLKVHVLPAQPEQLAFAHAQGHRKDVEPFKRVTVRCCQETVNLFAAQRLDILGAAAWSIDGSKRVGHAVTTLGSTVERCLERHVDVMGGGAANPAGKCGVQRVDVRRGRGRRVERVRSPARCAGARVLHRRSMSVGRTLARFRVSHSASQSRTVGEAATLGASASCAAASARACAFASVSAEKLRSLPAMTTRI